MSRLTSLIREPPSIEEFNIEKNLKAGDQSIDLVVKISDNKGLGSIIIMQRGGGQIDALVADYSPEGEKNIIKKYQLNTLNHWYPINL